MMKTTFWGIVELVGRAAAIGAGVAAYIATKDITTAIAVTTTVGTIVGATGAIASMKAQDAPPKN